MYLEHSPSPQLAPYIEVYWTSFGEVGEPFQLRILPDGCVDIILTLNDSPYLSLTPYRPAVVGTITSFINCTIAEGNEMVGIRFRPAGFTAFSRVPINELTDHQVDITLVETLFDERFCAELPQKTNGMEVIRYLDSYLTSRLCSIFTPERQIVHAVRLINQYNGLLHAEEVAKECCLSLRHFERKFKSTVGVSPKMYSRIIKFQYAYQYLQEHPEYNIFEVAIDCGYYDKAHLIKEFKALSGTTPSELRR